MLVFLVLGVVDQRVYLTANGASYIDKGREKKGPKELGSLQEQEANHFHVKLSKILNVVRRDSRKANAHARRVTHLSDVHIG